MHRATQRRIIAAHEFAHPIDRHLTTATPRPIEPRKGKPGRIRLALSFCLGAIIAAVISHVVNADPLARVMIDIERAGELACHTC